MQEQFISYLKVHSNNNTSFVDEIASVLDIGYDAAYRRINSKTSLTLEEGVKLAKHYKISLNNLFEVGNQNTILAELSPKIIDEVGLESWFNNSIQNLTPLTKLKSASIIYSAKDIPVFHTLKDTYLSRFKLFVWLKDVDVEMTKNKTSFDSFIKNIPDSLLESAFKLGETYNNISITEFWNNNTVNGSLQQVLYYYESNLISKNLALHICDDIEDVIHHIEQQAIQQSIIGSKNRSEYYLYKSPLHIMSNTIMVKTPYHMVFFQPFTVLSYFKIEHQPTCEILYDFFEKLMTNSMLLVNAGERERTLFFDSMQQKVKRLQEHIKNNNAFDFE
ncbi:MAG: hypothetical protein ABIO60_12175 [Aquaticitalea sp.]